MDAEISRIKKKILPILRRYKVKKAGIFGSYAKGKFTKNSDVDILVEVDKDTSLLDFIGIRLELEEILGKKVDLVEYSTIKPVVKEKILKEQVIIS